MIAALDGQGFTIRESMQIHLTAMNFARGVAISIEAAGGRGRVEISIEAEQKAETGLSQEDWLAQHEGTFAHVLSEGTYPMLARVVAVPDLDLGLDALFEYGMARLLDGVALELRGARHKCAR